MRKLAPFLARAAAAATIACLAHAEPALAKTQGEKPRPEVAVAIDADPGTIVIKTSEKKLYLLTGAGRALVYEIAVGRPDEQWFGKSWVSKKRLHPTWVPTPSMREKNPGLPQSVGPGPKNPLGQRAMNLGWTAYRIHGTNSPRSIGRAASSGCFRMRNADVLDLYDRVNIGAQVMVER
ncbi:L,D-transpeptidase [Aurantimonas sp. VKM B-3413]|uniref:L,D-transpeptidase n=1 Tax=Aurantimonas sp. VKM B-3413 TaxID=2779401 RepID=UPI001E3B92B7|nr:L,D-transpeptidase [Aurantimonas sp. VKM B-3413]MCB8838705.1 L,D-transpeptidase [Aurantimonas sp. VKM B-3413]